VAEAKDEVREQYAREYPPAPSEKPREGATPRTEAADTLIQHQDWCGYQGPSSYERMREHARQLERELAQTRLELDSARNVLARAIEHERLANMRATEWEEAAQSAQRALAEQIALAHNLAVDALRGPQSASENSDTAKDAVRYRWLRSASVHTGTVLQERWWELLGDALDDEFDDLLDSAMKENGAADNGAKT
jgi:hypothetical protein